MKLHLSTTIETNLFLWGLLVKQIVTTLRSTCSPAGGGVLPGERGRSHTPVTCSSLNYGEDKTLDSNTPLPFVQGIDSLWRSHFFCEPLFVYSPYQPFLLPIWIWISPLCFWTLDFVILSYLYFWRLIKSCKSLFRCTCTLCTVETSWP